MCRPLLFLVSIILALQLAAQDDRCTATLETIAQQVGETVDFCGTPTQVTLRNKGEEGTVFLNFGGNYPDNTFSVVIWGDVAGAGIGDLPQRFSGKSLLVHGVVSMHGGKPEIKLGAMKDIEVQEE